MDGAALQIERERSHVWFSAMLPHLKKGLSLEDFVGRRVRQKKQTPAQQQAMLQALAAAWGAKIQ